MTIERGGGVNLPNYSDLTYALSKAGRTEEARDVLAKLLKFHETQKTGTVSVAYAYASVGEWDEAFRWLEKAFEERSPYLGGIAADFSLEPLHGDPRFEEFLKKMNNPVNERIT
jgi:tetratricopeptide (TPR) repeat protein